jgi:phosphomannomutase
MVIYNDLKEFKGDFSKKKLFIFDVDRTLALSKQPIDEEMCELLGKLLEKREVALISGGKYKVFTDIYLKKLNLSPLLLNKLYLFPTCGSRFLRYVNGEHKQVYFEEISEEERKRIIECIHKMFEEIDFKHPETLYGEQIEDRKSQITFSAFGQKAPPSAKEGWDLDYKKRRPMIEVLKRMLPEYDIRGGGASSFDVTMKGIDKGYGIQKMKEYFAYDINEMFFAGDDLSDLGNDYSVHLQGVECLQVTSIEQTRDAIREYLRNL